MSSLARLGPTILENSLCNSSRVIATISRFNSNQSRGENSPSKSRPMVSAAELNPPDSNSTIESDIDEIPVPTTCCMSGCANCVWIQYAELLNEKFKNIDGSDVDKIIMDKVEDPNMRAFLLMELRCRNLIKS